MTRVELDIFKPVSNTYVLFVRTEDRGLAIKTVMAELKSDCSPFINLISARLCGSHEVPDGRVLEPISAP